MIADANTYEEMTIHNVNAGTAGVARRLGEYLLEAWGIRKLSLTVDGVHYGDGINGAIREGTGLHAVCGKLAGAKEIALAMRSENGGDAGWRFESSLMKALTDDAAIRRNVVYRSVDCYDTDPEIEMVLYGENGLSQPDYTDSAERVSDIKQWYCHAPTLYIADAPQSKNAELHDAIVRALTELCGDYFGLDAHEIDDKLEDDWEDLGEINLGGGLCFEGTNIPGIVASLDQLFKQVEKSDTAEIEFEMYAIPDGEADYPFASVSITYDGEAVRTGYCRF